MSAPADRDQRKGDRDPTPAAIGATDAFGGDGGRSQALLAQTLPPEGDAAPTRVAVAAAVPSVGHLDTLPAPAVRPVPTDPALAATLFPQSGAAASRDRDRGAKAFAATVAPGGVVDVHALTLAPPSAVDVHGATLAPETPVDVHAATLGGDIVPVSVSINAAAAVRGDFPVASWDRYEFQKKLGQGGMGAVYKARDRRLGRDVALKFIRGGDPNMVMRFLQEARAQARIDHPNVCKVYEVGEVDGKAYIAMQYVDGKPLDKAASDVSLTEKVLLMRRVADAMHEAHKLGIIHRDLKPDNIMVERLTDGSLSPVVMDFGLARESSENRGLTESGAVMGTPAYMAPEQARGDVRTLDRRADVYSLGATLYDLIAGVPPFDAETVVDVLIKVMHDEATPLRTRLPSVPPDLETIVMKCLRKEPSARYDSAKALADDLQRYIDGEPILGRRESIIGRVRRRARRNRAIVVVSAVSFVFVVGFAVQWVRVQLAAARERARAAERVKVERQLAQDVKDIEWFLRSAYQLPLHDIGPQQAIVRRRMAAIEDQRAALRGDDGGRIDYAIGRGHLALREPLDAVRYLTQAKGRGLDLPELHYALGRALGELFQQSLEEARRQGDKSWLDGRRAELEAQYLQPAVAELEHSRGGTLDSPDYLDGLLAFYRKQYDVALAKARRAATDSPWLYEARQLEGDVLLASGTDQKDHGQYNEGKATLEAAIVAYKQAADVGRSDAISYESIAEAYIQQSEIARNASKPPKEFLDQAIEYAGKSITAAPSRAAGYTKKAYAHFWTAFGQLTAQQDPRPQVAMLIAAAEQALKLNPKDAYAYDAIGNGYMTQGYYEFFRGKDPLLSWEKGKKAIEMAIEIAPKFLWAINDLSTLYLADANYLIQNGRNPLVDVRKAIRLQSDAATISNDYVNSYGSILSAYEIWVRFDRASGVDSLEIVNAAKARYDELMKFNKNVFVAHFAMCAMYLSYGGYLVDVGKDPAEVISELNSIISTIRKIAADDYRSDALESEAIALSIRYGVKTGKNVDAEVGMALKIIERCIEKKADDSDCLISRAKLRVLSLEIQLGRGRTSALDAAMREAVRTSQVAAAAEPTNPDAVVEYVRSLLFRAVLDARKYAQKDIADARVAMGRVLEKNQNHARTHAILGVSYLVEARQSSDLTVRAEKAELAARSFRRAFAICQTLRTEYQRQSEEAQAMLRP